MSARTRLSIINTNARSLCPKINSLIDCMEEIEASIAIVTETWLRDGQALQDDMQDLSLGAGLGMICRNRSPARNGVTYGGVAIIWREAVCGFREVKTVRNSEGFEVLIAAGSLAGHSRKILCVAAYIPSGYTKRRGEAALEYINDVVVDIKRRYRGPQNES